MRRFLPSLLAAFTLLGCGGAYREFPRWRFTAPAPAEAGCAAARAWVRTSGKTGVGLSVELRSRGDCVVTFKRAELVLTSGERFPATAPAPVTLRGRSLIYVWVPFEFDNNRAWNDGHRDGSFEFELDASGATTAWILPAAHRREHRYVPGSDPWRR